MLEYVLTEAERHAILLKLKGVSWASSPSAARRADEVIAVLKNLPKAAPSTSQPLAQPAQQPLTKIEISNIARHYGVSIQGFDHITAYTRAIEAAHGIGLNNE